MQVNWPVVLFDFFYLILHFSFQPNPENEVSVNFFHSIVWLAGQETKQTSWDNMDVGVLMSFIYINDRENCINFGKSKHIIRKACIGKSASMNTLINLNTLDWPKNVPQHT